MGPQKSGHVLAVFGLFAFGFMSGGCGLMKRRSSESSHESLQAHSPHRTISTGSPRDGRLINGVQLLSSPFLNVRPKRNYGTPETIDGIEQAVQAVHEAFAATPKLYVGDLSIDGGGPLKPHRSHQNGRDVDIGIYLKTGHSSRGFKDAHPHTMDIPRTWAFIWALVSQGNTKYIFLDYPLQEPLYRYAKEVDGVSEETLKAIFAYPNGPKAHGCIVRHWPGHRNHLHIRFHKGNSSSASRRAARTKVKPQTRGQRAPTKAYIRALPKPPRRSKKCLLAHIGDTTDHGHPLRNKTSVCSFLLDDRSRPLANSLRQSPRLPSDS